MADLDVDANAAFALEHGYNLTGRLGHDHVTQHLVVVEKQKKLERSILNRFRHLPKAIRQLGGQLNPLSVHRTAVLP